jgi:hypothetical protein
MHGYDFLLPPQEGRAWERGGDFLCVYFDELLNEITTLLS